MDEQPKALTSSDVAVGARFSGGKMDRIRVVLNLHAQDYWVWWRWNSNESTVQCSSMPAFLKWAKEKIDG